jgi:phosphoenolpyruvate-protein kinase (PTS system EI component)
MAFGDEKEGTLYLWEVPNHLRTKQHDEEENIDKFWDREVSKCMFITRQREEKKEEWAQAKANAERKRALEDAAKEVSEETKLQKEEEKEDEYQMYLLIVKNKLKLITDEELAEEIAKKKKKN